MPGHHLSPGSQGQTPGGPAIPQASVRPLVRPAKHEPMDPDIKPPVQSKYTVLLFIHFVIGKWISFHNIPSYKHILHMFTGLELKAGYKSN